MPDPKEPGREPTESEREAAFEPHHSAKQQPDGDPGVVRPGGEQDAEESENEAGEMTGDRGEWKKDEKA